MPVALVDDAFRWWQCQGGYALWPKFKEDLLKAFGLPDLSRRLRQELDARTQHPEEDLGSFVRTIREYYDRIQNPYTEQEVIERVLLQVNPQCRQILQFRSFDTLESLEDIGADIEALAWRDVTYKLPPSRDNMLAKDLAFVP
jgi:hypothetical protein